MRNLTLTCLIWIVVIETTLCLSSNAQTNPPATDKSLAGAAKEGVSLNTLIVGDAVGIKAVLLTPKIIDRVFGKDVRNNYAVVHLTISNRSKDAAFILHHCFLDYSHWGISKFAGGNSGENVDDTKIGKYGVLNNQKQLGSVEARIVRGHLQEAQNWSWRNVLIRSAKTAGSIAAAYAFSINEQGIVRGISSYNGNFIPALETLIPDPLIGQINRISDYGFRTPMVVPREDGNIMVAFFPLDRLLTPSLKRIYLKSPAVFFNPELLLADPQAQKDMKDIIDISVTGGLAGLQEAAKKQVDQQLKNLSDEVKTSSKNLVEANKSGDASKPQLTPTTAGSAVSNPRLDAAIAFIRSLSLDNVRVGVEGVLVVDIRTVPASISDIDWENPSDSFWLTPGDKAGVVRGRSLEGGKVRILNADALGITDVITTSTLNEDGGLGFQCKFAKEIPVGTQIRFVVEKEAGKLGKNVSNEFSYAVSYFKGSPAIKDLKWAKPKLTITGSSFFDTTDAPRSVELKIGAKSISYDSFASATPAKIEMDLATLGAGCYAVSVHSGNLTSVEKRNFAVLPELKLSATIQDDNVAVKLASYPDLKDCGIKRTFVASKDGETDVKLSGETLEDGVILLPKGDKIAKGWTVKVMLGDEAKGSAPIQ